jgi:hypothetical protein
MNQTRAHALIGILHAFPLPRYVVFATDNKHAAAVTAHFLDKLSVTLKEDYTTRRLGERLGVRVLSFSALDYEKVRTCPGIAEIATFEEARIEAAPRAR